MIRKASCSAFTLVEVIAGAAVASLGLLAVASLNTANLRFVKSTRQSNAATLCLQERVEQMRLADWRKLTSASYLSNTLLAGVPQSAAPLIPFTEKITVSAFPDETVAESLIVQRNASGEKVTQKSGEGLATQRLAKIELQFTWTGSDGRTRTRAATTLMTNGGISRMNLPAFSATGSPSSTPTPTATPTPAPGATPAPTPTPTPTPTPSPGNGRGNVGGKSGKN